MDQTSGLQMKLYYIMRNTLQVLELIVQQNIPPKAVTVPGKTPRGSLHNLNFIPSFDKLQ